jgi:hypothetical protein
MLKIAPAFSAFRPSMDIKKKWRRACGGGAN